MLLAHTELSDKEKLFYQSESDFVDRQTSHYRGLATISATEMGFLLASMTLSGTNEFARTFVLTPRSVLAIIAMLLLIVVGLGSFQGRFISLMLLHGNRASFYPTTPEFKCPLWPAG